MIYILGLATLVANIWAWIITIWCVLDIIQHHAGSREVFAGPGRRLADLHREIRPFALPGILVILSRDVRGHHWVDALVCMVSLYVWWISRNWPDDHDERWKKRAKRLGEAVRRQGAKLAVVPDEAPA